ncbi:hypothetical protein B0J13DRAFT_646515 [Dactylonectria estremocensis]|uniref:Uncharacterized protein n=1 Tax=Dactylonectria estremocensis TaxID=1079267 RepID=A0A9P9DWR4_9HYPO|nr:hypothetical protein B0J13DRAFT_646515 [Dactylonectria estremocensis]
MADDYPHQGLPDKHAEGPVGVDFGNANTRRWKWSVNVILIGTSQSGKSTFINRFRSLAVGPYPLPGPANVGKGTFACTTDPFLYEFDIPMTDYVLTEGPKATLVESPDDERSIFDLGLWKRKDLRVEKRDPHADIARLRLLDTPGLDDDRPEMNAKNIEKVLQRLSVCAESTELDQRHISAVVFVIKSGNSFNASIQKWYHHYQRCMPNLFGSIAVVNTSFRLKDWKSEYATTALNALTFGGTKLTSRDMKMKRRREAWAEIFHSDPTHFFIDNKPASGSPFQEFVSVNTVYDILLYLRSQGKLPIENVCLVKLPQMAAIDAQVARYLYEIQSCWEREKDQLFRSMSMIKQSLAREEKNRLAWANRIEELEKELAIWDSDVQFDLNTYSPTAVMSTPSKVWKFVTFSGHEKTFEIRENIYLFWVNAPDSDDTTWLTKRDASEADRTWRGRYKSKWRKVPKFTARSYTKSSIYHAHEINKAMKERDELQGKIADNDTALSSQLDNAAEESPRLVQLTEWLAQAEKFVRLLREEEVPLNQGFTPSAIARYGKSVDKIGYSEMLDFVAEQDPDLKPAFEVTVAYLAKK